MGVFDGAKDRTRLHIRDSGFKIKVHVVGPSWSIRVSHCLFEFQGFQSAGFEVNLLHKHTTFQHSLRGDG